MQNMINNKIEHTKGGTLLRSYNRRGGLVASLGSVAIIAAAFLPWFSLFAGLQPYAGIVGINGRLLLAFGTVALAMSALYIFQGKYLLRLGLSILGAGLLIFTIWLIAQLFVTFQELNANPLIIPRVGPGLFVAAVGSLMLSLTFLIKPSRINKESLKTVT